MAIIKEVCEISDEDLRQGLKEMETYVDVTEEDLKKIYSIALRHAKDVIPQIGTVENGSLSLTPICLYDLSENTVFFLY